MPCTQYTNQGQEHHSQRDSFRSTFNRSFVALRPTEPQQQNSPNFAIVSPSNYQIQNSNQSHNNQHQHARHYQQNHHQDPREMFNIVPRSSSQTIPRAILNVADDLTEQIRISVQHTHISPRVYLNEYLSSGGAISDVHDDFEGSVYYPTSAAYVANGNDQTANLNHEVSVASPPARGNELSQAQGSNHHYQTPTNHHQRRLTNNVNVSNHMLDVTNPHYITTPLQPQQSTSSSPSHHQYNDHALQRGESGSSTSSATSATAPSPAIAQPTRLTFITSSDNCNNKQQVDSSNILTSTEATPETLVSTTAASRIPISRHASCGNASTDKGAKCRNTQEQQRNGENIEKLAKECNVNQEKPLNIIAPQHDQQPFQCSQEADPDAQFGIFGGIPPFSSHRQAGVLKTSLHSGSSFSGYQKSSKESYEVNVKIQYIDFERSYLCGYLCINHLLETHPSLTTFFEGEIISEKYPFLTKKWFADEDTDYAHWSKFEGFDDNLVKTLKARKNFDYNRLKNSDYVYMRWKEQFLVPDHKIKEIFGASYDGFYYICYSKTTSRIKGYYYHQSTENFER